jgi:hypothetical protein
MLITFTFLFGFVAGIAATLAAIGLYPVLKDSQLIELVVIAVRNSWMPASQRGPHATEQTGAGKERAMAAGLPTR